MFITSGFLMKYKYLPLIIIWGLVEMQCRKEFNGLKDLQYKWAGLQHHEKVYSRSLEEGITPRGLRLKKTPLLGKVSHSFLKRWKNCLFEAEQKLLRLLRSEAQRKQSFVLRSFQNRIEILTRKEGDQVVKGWLVSLERLREKWMDDLTSKRGRKFKTWSKDRVKRRRALSDTVIGDLHNLIKRNDEYNKLTLSGGSKVGGIVRENSNLDNFVEVHGDINDEEINENSLRDGRSQLEGKNDKNQIHGKVISENSKFMLSNNVVNLSERNFTQGEISLLSKGLKFCPTPKELNKSAIKRDLKEFGRKIKCKYHFLSNPKEQERHNFERFKEKSG